MPKLVIHGPRGPPPPRGSVNSPSTSILRDSSATPRSRIWKQVRFAEMPDLIMDGDNINIQQKVKDVMSDAEDDDHPLSDLEKIEQKVNESCKIDDVFDATNRQSSLKGQAAMHEQNHVEFPEMVDINEDVDEGDIDYYEKTDSSSAVDDFDGDEDKGVKTVISLSSDDEEKAEDFPFGMTEKPWKHFTQDMRAHWETSYCHVTQFAIQGSWDFTEEYQREKDKEMLRYIEDHPLPTWIIPKEDAEHGYYRMLERSRWRGLGIRIYGSERIPELIPGSTMARQIQMQQPLNPNRSHYPGQPNHRSAMPPQYGPPPMHMQVRSPLPGMLQPHSPPILRSQPHAQPTHVPLGFPMGQHDAQQMNVPPYSMRPPHMSHASVPMQASPPSNSIPLQQLPEVGKTGKSKPRKATTSPPTPPPPSRTPPYEKHEKPAESKDTNKFSRRNMRKQAECKEYPWHRQGIDFKEAKAKASWDDSGYDPEMLNAMEETRRRNMPIVEKQDEDASEKQRQSRQAKKKGMPMSEEPSLDVESKRSRRSKQQKDAKPNKNELQGDPYHTGNFAFATPEAQQNALSLKYQTLDEVMDAATAGKLDWELCKAIKICWNPGKKGTTEVLEQAVFSIKDTLLTREKLARTPILTARAVERIIDFCPDMLFRETLLRMVAEGGYGNLEIRNRYSYNGCYCDKATITKRITACLGQKQEPNSARNRKKVKEAAAAKAAGQALKKKTWKRYLHHFDNKVKGYAPGEAEWFSENQQGWHDYLLFFGRKPSHRIPLKPKSTGLKRERVEEPKSDGERIEKRAKTEETELDVGAPTPGSEETEDADEMDVDCDTAAAEDGEEDEDEDIGGEEEDDEEHHEHDDEDAVSVQDSDVLDEIED